MKANETGMVQLSATIQEKVGNKTLDTKGCDHFLQVVDVTPSAEGCEDSLLLDGYIVPDPLDKLFSTDFASGTAAGCQLFFDNNLRGNTSMISSRQPTGLVSRHFFPTD